MRDAAGEGEWDEQISVAKQSRVGARERSSPIVGLAAALSHFCEEPERVIAIGVYHRQTTEGRGRGRGVIIGIPEPNLVECRVNSTPLRSCPNVPQSHTDFEV